MVCTPSPDDARTIALKAIELMEQHGVPATPDNYHVWYTYVSGENGALTKAIDILLSNGSEFDEACCRDIFHQFFTPDQDALHVSNTVREVQREIQRILDFVADTSVAHNGYDATLKEVSGNLVGNLSVTEIRSLLDTLIAETENMQVTNQSLRRELEESTQEITALRENLTSARIESMTDSLTGLANRAQFDKNLRQAAMNCMETGEDLSVIIADVDNFKKFNDQWGHLLGDQVLKLIGAVLQKSVNGIDTAARFGGEEFTVLLPNTSLHDATSLAEKIRTDISSRKAKKRDTGETIGRITCSFGVAVFRKGEPLSALIERADRALYEAKKTGRNRVVDESVLPDEEPESASQVA